MATLALPLPPRQSRALALVLLALALALGIGLLTAPFLLLHRHYDRAIGALEDRIEVYRRVAAQTPELKKALDALRAKDGRRFFLRNTALNLAGAELQDLVRGAIENNGGRITTIQTAQPREDGRFRQVGINVQLFATTPNLQKIVYTLETQTPYTVIDNITVRPLNAFRGFKPTPGNEPELSVLLDVVGFALAEDQGNAGAPKSTEGAKK
jgi:general secretion pathway protein M